MTGGALLGLILISMGWLLFLGGLATNYYVLRRQFKAKEGDARPSGMGFLPGVVGSLTVFFTIPALTAFGWDVPWPWLWIALPLFLDPYCLPGLWLLLRK